MFIILFVYLIELQWIRVVYSTVSPSFCCFAIVLKYLLHRASLSWTLIIVLLLTFFFFAPAWRMGLIYWWILIQSVHCYIIIIIFSVAVHFDHKHCIRVMLVVSSIHFFVTQFEFQLFIWDFHHGNELGGGYRHICFVNKCKYKYVNASLYYLCDSTAGMNVAASELSKPTF